jgi:glutamate synthase (ferredoxin)
MVSLADVSEKYDILELQDILTDYVKETGSVLAKEILDDFEKHLPDFKKVIPNDYQKMTLLIGQFEEQGIPHEKAVLEAFAAFAG